MGEGARPHTCIISIIKSTTRELRGESMYAVIRAGGKQYRVAPGDVIRVEKQADEDGRVTLAMCSQFRLRRVTLRPRDLRRS